MESFALTLFVLCACAGLLTVAVLARWLRSQPLRGPDIDLDFGPDDRAVKASALTQSAPAGQPVAPSTFLEDDATQPMTRTQTSWGATDWPSTLPADALAAMEAQAMDDAAPHPTFADTQPMPVEPEVAR